MVFQSLVEEGWYCVPLGWAGLFPALGRSAPLPRLPGGGPHFSREMGRKRAGAPPLDPRYYGRSFPLADFWDRCFWYDSGAITSDMLRPIWGAFSGKNMLKSIFAKDSPQIRARKWLQLKTTTVLLCPTTPKRASANERAIKEGGAGGHPPRLFASGLSLEKAWLPRPGPGGNPPRRVHPAPVPPTGGYLPPNRHHPRRAAVLTGGGIYCKSVCRQGIVGMPPHSQAGGHNHQADCHAQEEGVKGQVHKVPCQNGNGPG